MYSSIQLHQLITLVFSFTSALIINILVCNTVFAGDHGHNLFASLAQLRRLWEKEQEIVRSMEQILNISKTCHPPLQTYVKRHYILMLNMEPNFEYLGHPINSYHFIHHMASGWPLVMSYVTSAIKSRGLKNCHDLRSLRKYNGELLPDFTDVKGAAYGIARLWMDYRIDTNELFDNGRIVTSLLNGQKIESEPSVIGLYEVDYHTMAREALRHKQFHAAVTFFELMSKRVKKVHSKDNLNLFGGRKIDSHQSEALLTNALRLHDEKLHQYGEIGLNHRCREKPFRENITYAHDFSKEQMTFPELVGRSVFDQYLKDSNNSINHYTIVNLGGLRQSEKLCAGRKVQDLKKEGLLKCTYASSASNWLRLGPFKYQINSQQIGHATILELISLKESHRIKSLAMARELENHKRQDEKKPHGMEDKNWSEIRQVKLYVCFKYLNLMKLIFSDTYSFDILYLLVIF